MDRVNEFSAGGIVLRQNEQEGLDVLLIQHRGHKGWGFPKGWIEPGETPQQAAIREVEEESGVRAEIIADEAPWVYNMSVMGDHWLLNYCPHLYQVPGYLPVNDYTAAAKAGDYNKAIDIARSLNPLRTALSRWIPGYGGAGGRTPAHEQKYWMELIGMKGGTVRAPQTELPAEARAQMRSTR